MILKYCAFVLFLLTGILGLEQ